jgi:circadian clock protein KaiC
LTGYPGSGKTILSANFIYEGATRYGEPGVYACFAESKKTFIREMNKFGWDFEALTHENHFAILDLSIASDIDIQSSLNLIMEAVMKIHARRLVIDSITALSVGLKSRLEKRQLIRLLYKLVQKVDCTTIMITDMPWGTERIGEDIEEFIVDGIILLQGRYDEMGLLRRQLRVLKMRETEHALGTFEYKIEKNGIEIDVEPKVKGRSRTREHRGRKLTVEEA